MPDPDGRRTFVTHKKPHLDEVVAAWLLRQFDPAMATCDYLFIANTPTGGEVPPGDQYVPVGVGRGQFDEHGMSVGHSACQLVYHDLQHRGLIPNDDGIVRALDMLVHYTHQQDTAQWENLDPLYTNFTIPSILRGLAVLNAADPSPVMMNEGLAIINAVFANLHEYAQFLQDWEHRIEFESRWGKAVGVHSRYRATDIFAYHHGFILRVQTDPTKPYGDFRAPAKSYVDLTDLYQRLISREPDRWYLHQSKKLLVSNDDTTAGRRGTDLSLPQLIDLVKK